MLMIAAQDVNQKNGYIITNPDPLAAVYISISESSPVRHEIPWPDRLFHELEIYITAQE